MSTIPCSFGRLYWDGHEQSAIEVIKNSPWFHIYRRAAMVVGRTETALRASFLLFALGVKCKLAEIMTVLPVLYPGDEQFDLE